MNNIKSICVFCGSHTGSNPLFKKETILLGQTMAKSGYKLVYGGANVGLMKVLAESFMNEGGIATGIIPHFLAEKHLVQPNLSETILVDTMHERKHTMSELADAFIALPGGYGTLEELFEVITASQLSLHTKPIVLGNFDGFYDHLIAHREKMIECEFVDNKHRETYLSGINAIEVIEKINSYEAPQTPKYVTEVFKKYNS